MSTAVNLKKIRSLLEKARKSRLAGEPAEAKSLIKELLQGFDINATQNSGTLYAELCYELGICQLTLRKTQSALTAFERAHESAPQATDASLRIVECKMDSEGALNNNMVLHYLVYLQRGSDRNIRHGTLRRLQQILRITLTERPAVVVWRMEMLDKLHGLVPELDFPKLYLGRGHYLREHFDKCIAVLKKLRDKTGQSHNVLNMMARSYEKIGNLKQAYELYDRSLKKTPGQAGVHFRLGRLDLKLSEL